MDFSTPAAIGELCGRVRRIVEDELFPLERVFLDRGWSAVLPAMEVARERVKAAGLWAPQLPSELGGLGLALRDFALVARELGRSLLGHYAFNCQRSEEHTSELQSPCNLVCR